MINKNTLFIAVFGLLALASCKKKNEDKPPVVIQPELMDSLFTYKYEGLIPCADCPGIETIIQLNADSTLNKFIYYQDKNDFPENKIGTWRLKDSVFEANFDGSKEFYRIQSGRAIARVGSDRKAVKGVLADNYLLHLKTPVVLDSLQGTYVQGDSLKGYYQVLELDRLKKDAFQVKVNFGGEELGCEFEAKGIYNRALNQIEVAVLDSVKEPAGSLLVVFSKHLAHLKSVDSDAVLQNYCATNKQLTGSYAKSKKVEPVITEE